MTYRFAHVSDRKTEVPRERIGLPQCKVTGGRPSTARPPEANPPINRDMVFHMKATLNIDDSVMQKLREEAARRGTTMSLLVEAGLRRVLSEPAPPTSPSTGLPALPTWNGGKELVDISNRDALYKAMEEE